jgi:peptidoglycan/LPS O-acetylase OafA/YrhL
MLTTSTAKNQDNIWRSDIEGLRAIAILSVIAFHLNQQAAPNGYLGVDIFFVITGYLIYGQLLGNGYANSIENVVLFCKRRFLRVFPTLIIWIPILIFVLSFYLLPKVHDNYLITGYLSLLSLSNLHLAITGFDYFGPKAYQNPFLPMWSISVEDQFYLLIALVLYLSLKRGVVALSTITLFVLSLLYAADMNLFGLKGTHYSIGARYFEFLTGGLFYLFERGGGGGFLRWLKLPAMASLLILVFYPWQLSGGQIYIYLVCVMTGIVLAVRPSESDIAYRLVSSNFFMLFVGRISFGLYVFHMPIITIFELSYGPFLGVGLSTVLCIAAMLLLAWLNYKLVETRIINYYRTANPKLIGIRKAYFLLPLFVSLTLSICFSYLNRFNTTAVNWADQISQSTLTPTRIGTQNVYILGDSHAQMLFPAFNQIADEGAYSFIDKSGSACFIGPDVSYRVDGKVENRCLAHQNTFFKSLYDGEIPVGSIIFIGNRVSAYTLPRLLSYADKPVEGFYIADSYYTVSDGDSIDKYVQLIHNLVKELPTYKFVYLLPIPELLIDTSRCIHNPTINECSVDRSVEEAYLRDLKSKLLTIEEPNMRFVDAIDTVCTDKKCANIVNGIAIYRDDDHLSKHGALRTVSNIRAALNSWN